MPTHRPHRGLHSQRRSSRRQLGVLLPVHSLVFHPYGVTVLRWDEQAGQVALPIKVKKRDYIVLAAILRFGQLCCDVHSRGCLDDAPL